MYEDEFKLYAYLMVLKNTEVKTGIAITNPKFIKQLYDKKMGPPAPNIEG